MIRWPLPVRTFHRPAQSACLISTLAVTWLLLFTLSATRPIRTVRAYAQDPYPAPSVPDIAPMDDGLPAIDSAQPYPAPTSDVLGIVGSDIDVAPADEFGIGSGLNDTAVLPQQQSPTGLYFLWGSFLAALLIFATAIVGSLVLFARRVE